jgi:hypothetical protein
MPIDITPGSFAAVTITTLFWWTVLSPVGLLAVAALCARRPRLRGALTLVVLAPPVLTLLPVAVMSDGVTRFAAAGAVVLLGAAIALAVSSLVRTQSRPERAERRATAALLFGVAGGMLGSGALVGALLFT